MTELAKKSFAAVPAVFVFSVIQQILLSLINLRLESPVRNLGAFFHPFEFLSPAVDLSAD